LLVFFEQLKLHHEKGSQYVPCRKQCE
jgi:hypothetical protein